MTFTRFAFAVALSSHGLVVGGVSVAFSVKLVVSFQCAVSPVAASATLRYVSPLNGPELESAARTADERSAIVRNAVTSVRRTLSDILPHHFDNLLGVAYPRFGVSLAEVSKMILGGALLFENLLYSW